MIDVKELKTRYDEIAKNIKDRYMNVDLDKIVKDQEERAALLLEVENLRSKRNETAQKMKQKLDNETRQRYIQEGKDIKEALAEKEARLAVIDEEFKKEVMTIPNYASPEAPIGKEDKDNLAIKFYGEPTRFSFKAKDHVQLGEELDILDFDKGAKVSGQKFYYIKNKAVILQMALERYAMDIVMKHGFTPFITPDVAKEEILKGIGFNPRGNESNVYAIEDEGTCLVATAEITLGGYHSGEILDKSALPLFYCGLSHCFRREAGAAGQFSKGLYRVHQFDKVEMFVYCLPEDSNKLHEKLRLIEEEIFEGLGIPFHVVDTCTGDLGAPAYRKWDLEAWMPSRATEEKPEGDYGEVTSTSNCTDFQSRRLNVKYHDDDGKNKYVHMLNGTAIAVGRAMLAIMENYQNEDGSITVPPALVPFCGFDKIGPKTEIKDPVYHAAKK